MSARRDEVAAGAERREHLLEQLGGAVAIIPSARQLLSSRDTEVRFRQDRDFWYLTGFGEPDAVMVLSPHDPKHRFTLFVRPRDPDREVWNGPRAGVEGARERWGADSAYPIHELDSRLRDLLEPADRVVFSLGRDPALDRRVIELISGFRATRPRSGRGPLELADPDLFLGPMRQVKSGWEVDRIRAAAALSAEGHRAGLAAARPGAGEWEIEAAVEGRFRSRGAAGPAYPSIVGSGPNATVLHHVANDRRVRDGDLVLLDAGAELEHYCGDITRTFPASGSFSPAQRAVYEVVAAAEAAAIAAVRPDVAISAVHDAAVRILAEGMVSLGLLSGTVDRVIESAEYKRFYMHQTSHWLGLDVHDVGPYRIAGEPVRLRPGTVLTVEPGIYIPADSDGVPAPLRGIGVRIEDDVLVTEDGHEVLTCGIPVAADEIEALVGS